ncbi:MAG: archaeosortase/exosortase family protein [Bacteroidota bacterium]
MGAQIDKKSLLKGFAIKAVITFVAWMVLYYGFIIPDGRLNRVLTNTVIAGTVFGLSTLGYDTSGEGDMVLINDQPVVLVADACNGLELFALYIGFLLCFPGKWKYKAFFIPIGLILIYVINVMREIVLALNYKFFQETFDFNHKYTYVFIVYLFVFALWRFWLNRYSILARG